MRYRYFMVALLKLCTANLKFSWCKDCQTIYTVIFVSHHLGEHLRSISNWDRLKTCLSIKLVLLRTLLVSFSCPLMSLLQCEGRGLRFAPFSIESIRSSLKLRVYRVSTSKPVRDAREPGDNGATAETDWSAGEWARRSGAARASRATQRAKVHIFRGERATWKGKLDNLY